MLYVIFEVTHIIQERSTDIRNGGGKIFSLNHLPTYPSRVLRPPFLSSTSLVHYYFVSSRFSLGHISRLTFSRKNKVLNAIYLEFMAVSVIAVSTPLLDGAHLNAWHHGIQT